MAKLIEKLENAGACYQAREWAKTQPSAKAAWANCERGDWMLWISAKAANTEAKRKKVALAACACARLSLKYAPTGELRPKICIETVERWARGEATLEEVKQARSAATAATADAAANAAADAAYAAAYAANAAAADAAANAAAAAAAADAAANAAAAARAKTLKKCADICRRMLAQPRL